MIETESIYAPVMFLLGLVLGSFLNVCIYRLPRGMSVVHPRSACPKCHQPVRGYDNIPVLSWLILRGRCRRCHNPISARYIVVELLTGLLFFACFLNFGLTLATLKYCVLMFLLLGLIFTDAELKLLPDKLTLPGLALGLVFSLLVPVSGIAMRMLPLEALPFSSDITIRIASLLNALLGAAVGAGFIYVAAVVYLWARDIEGMGFGDVKLMAMIGAFLGFPVTLFVLFAASLAGSLIGLLAMVYVWVKRTRRRLRQGHTKRRARARAWQSARLLYRRFEIPFGVFLGGAAIFSVFYALPIIAWYLDFYH